MAYKNPYTASKASYNPYTNSLGKKKKKSSYGYGDDEDELQRSIQNYGTRLNMAGLDLPEPKQDKGSILGKAFMGALNTIDRPANAIRGAIDYSSDKDASTTIGQGIKEGLTREKTFTGDRFWDEQKIEGKGKRFAAELAYQVLTDPLSYGTFGLGGFAKGLATGRKATMSKSAVKAVKGAEEAKRVNRTKQAIFEQYSAPPKPYQMRNVKNKAGVVVDVKPLAPRDIVIQNFYGTNRNVTRALRDRFDDDVTRIALGGKKGSKESLDALRKRALDPVAQDVQNAMGHKAGPGLRFAGQKLVSGTKMQDAGATLAETLSKIPKIGAAGEKGRKLAGEAFESFNIAGIDKTTEAAMRIFNSSRKGLTNFENMHLLNKTRAIQHVLSGMVDSAGKPVAETLSSALEGPLVRNAAGGFNIPNEAYSRIEKAGLWNAPLARDASTKKALKALDLDETATLSDLAEVIRKDFTKAGHAEQSAGRLGSMQYAGSGDSALKQGIGYVPRKMTPAAQGVRAGGRYSDNAINPRNQFSIGRNEEKWKGMTIEDINKEQAAKYGSIKGDDYKLFEEDITKVYMSRMLAHNRVMAASDTASEAMAALGEKVTFKNATPDVLDKISRALDDGMEVVMPSTPGLAKSGDIVDDIVQAGFVPVHTLSAPEIFRRMEQGSGRSFTNVAGVKGTVKADTHFYIVPQGFTKMYSGNSAKQTIAAAQAMQDVVNGLYSKWKPLVTSFNMKFHTRNLMSATMNNFLDLGTAMFDPKVHAEALRMSFGNIPGIGKAVKNASSVANYENLMKNNAVSAFGSSEANALRRGLDSDLVRAASGKSNMWDKAEGFGRAVGNRTEEYVRSVNYLAHIKQGFSPEMAADMVRSVHFDYADLSNFEQSIKLVVPFYTWIRNNLPFQMQHLLDDPRLYQNVYRAAKESAQANGIDFHDLPDYMQENMAMTVGQTDDGKAKVLDMGLPMSDLFTDSQDVAGMLSPLIKAPIELYTDQSLLTGGPLYGYDEKGSVNLFKDTTLVGSAAQMADKLTGGKLQDFMTQKAPGVGKALDYGSKQLGALGNLNRYGASTSDSASSKTTQMQFDRYNNDIPSVIRSAMGVVDPRTGHLKYVDPEKLSDNAKWEYYYQLGNYLQMLKDQGHTIPTITELKKAKILPYNY